MSSLFRVWNISNGGKQIINLTKISSFTLNDKTITFFHFYYGVTKKKLYKQYKT